jgi:hypothetical protein
VSNAPRDEVVARLLERLLQDESFRAAFQRDPESVLRSEGLDRLAAEIGPSRGKAMETLELRESRSNLAGMLMAVAAEGVGLLDSWQGRAGTAPVSSPPGQGSAGAEAAPAPADPAAAGAPEQRALIRAATPEQAAAAQLDDDQAGLWSERSGARAGLRMLQEGADHRRPRHDHDRPEHQRGVGREPEEQRREGGGATPRDRDPQGQQPSHDPSAVAFELLEDQVESAVEQDDRDRQLDERGEGLA